VSLYFSEDLKDLILHHTNIEGILPQQILILSSLKNVYVMLSFIRPLKFFREIHHTKISGTIPSELGRLNLVKV
jgi:hypothetical protein